MRALVPPCLSPEGLRLWSINSEGVHVKSSYKVGRFLSNGNQGRVYEVLRVVNDDDSNRRCHRRGNGPTAQTQWAIKLSPTMHAFAWNNLTEKQSKQVRFNLDSVDRERALYGKESMTKFLGKLIPNIPSEKAGDVPRYGYLFPDEDNTEKPSK